MPEPITYKSPKLTRCGYNLNLANGDSFVCVSVLKRLLELEKLPKANGYRIEASTEQWDDNSGFVIWIGQATGFCFWSWGFTQEQQRQQFHLPLIDALEDSGISKEKPVQIYFRLTYCE